MTYHESSATVLVHSNSLHCRYRYLESYCTRTPLIIMIIVIVVVIIIIIINGPTVGRTTPSPPVEVKR